MNQGTPHPADRHDRIRVHGVRVNNLKGLDIEIPKRRLTVFTGVSGSGKSSLVFGTIAAESQRLVNETYSAFVQGFMPGMARPEVDVLEGLTTAILLDQEQMGANPRSTVGTATDADAMLRVLFSRLGEPHIGPPSAFSPNVPSVSARGSITIGKGEGKKVRATYTRTGGMCARCEGVGQIRDLDVDEVVDRSKSLNEGPIKAPIFNLEYWRPLAEAGNVDPDKPLKDFTEQEWDDFWSHPANKKLSTKKKFEGLGTMIRRVWLGERQPKQKAILAFLDRALNNQPCPDCDGTRLAESARSVRLNGLAIHECADLQVSDLRDWLAGLDHAGPLTASLEGLLDSLDDIGLGYLSLSRPTGTLSGGEAQRVKMVRHLGSPLSDVTYVFDEPTVGLHPHDISRMVDLLKGLRDKGNTVLVVEHKPQVIDEADHVVDLGPLAGTHGGEITYEGDVEGLRASDTVTGRHLDTRTTVKDEVREPTGHLTIAGATLHNLQDVTVDVPLGVVCAVTGVAGSGKTSLIHGCMPERDDVVVVDQSAIRGSRRSNLATYTGMLDGIRDAFAKASSTKGNKVSASLFSANSDGGCPVCNGLGVILTDLGIMGEVSTPCEACEGRRFTDEAVSHTLHDKTIADVYAMSAGDALTFFDEVGLPQATTITQRLVDVGLGYLTLGQPLNTLSGGERQRLKLAVHRKEGPSIYVLDEPTSGLHLADVEHLLALLDRLVEDGSSVVVIEHHLAVMAHADWLIDLGPGAGHDGGRVVFEGTPAKLVAGASTVTGQHLAAYVNN